VTTLKKTFVITSPANNLSPMSAAKKKGKKIHKILHYFMFEEMWEIYIYIYYSFLFLQRTFVEFCTCKSENISNMYGTGTVVDH
jgi:hypothetical protein